MPESASPPPRRRRESFDGVAADYARFRPPYPDPVVDMVIAAARLETGQSVLEIGCGSGQLSVPLARQGIDLTAVELGEHLAALASDNLAGFPHARVVTSGFEEWPPPGRRFDSVVCASAFHWLDPDVRFVKCAALLRPGGRLVILHVHHVQGGTPGFFAASQAIYARWGLSDDPGVLPTTPGEAPFMYRELDQLPAFGRIDRRRFEEPRRLDTTRYVGWLRTDSLVLSLDGDDRAGFLGDMQALIDARYGGAVSRNFVYEIIAAERVDPA